MIIGYVPGAQIPDCLFMDCSGKAPRLEFQELFVKVHLAKSDCATAILVARLE